MVVANQGVLYTLEVEKSRILVVKISTLVLLSIVFYLGVLINLGLLALDGSTETLVKTSALFLLLTLIVIGSLHNLSAVKHGYRFYEDKIRFAKRNVSYLSIEKVERKENLWDKLFRTHSLQLNKKFSIDGIPNEVNVQPYVEQMLQYSKAKLQQQNSPQTSFGGNPKSSLLSGQQGSQLSTGRIGSPGARSYY